MNTYIKKFIDKFLNLLIKNFHKSNFFNNQSSVYLENFILFCKKKNTKFYYDKKSKEFYVEEDSKKIFFSDKIRGFNLYREGLKKRAKFIFSSYRLEHIIFLKDDIVIDCGANYGDLALTLLKIINPSNYFGIEPGPSFIMLKKNVSNNSILINKALGKKNENLPFYVSETEADSSLIETSNFTNILNVPVIKLEDLIKEYNIKEIKLLKIEAEGYEPEILEGLGKSLKICKYIAIDGGYERGINKEQTFTTQTNYLINNGFEMVDIFLPYSRALFVNKQFLLDN